MGSMMPVRFLIWSNGAVVGVVRLYVPCDVGGGVKRRRIDPTKRAIECLTGIGDISRLEDWRWSR